jgi:hypothetical protein
MTQVQAARERLERLRASIEENIRKSKVIVEESKALLGMLQRERSRYKSKRDTDLPRNTAVSRASLFWDGY